MAIRYCGTLRLDIRYERKTGDYSVRVTECYSDVPPVMLRGQHPLVAYYATYSADAYDSVARAACMFGLDPFTRSYAALDADGAYAVQRRDPSVRTVSRVPLNRGGYTRSGMYFGAGEKLWRYSDTRGRDIYLRAASKAEATALARSYHS